MSVSGAATEDSILCIKDCETNSAGRRPHKDHNEEYWPKDSNLSHTVKRRKKRQREVAFTLSVILAGKPSADLFVLLVPVLI